MVTSRTASGKAPDSAAFDGGGRITGHLFAGDGRAAMFPLLWHYTGEVAEGLFMREFRAFVLNAGATLLLLAFGSNTAAALVQAPEPSSAGAPGLILKAAIECGVFDGKFQCRPVRGGARQFGKSAKPGDDLEKPTSPETAPGGLLPGTGGGQAVQGGTPDPNACQGGMVGTPPNCRCPESTEQLGGICVRYTASTCSNGLAVNASPEACQGVEEKISCKLREDGLKDCCCVTYDKF